MKDESKVFGLLTFLFLMLFLAFWLLRKRDHVTVNMNTGEGNAPVFQECRYRHPTTGAIKTYTVPVALGYCPDTWNVGGIIWLKVTSTF